MDGQTTVFIDNTGYVHESYEGPPSAVASFLILCISFILGFTLNFTLLLVIVLNKDLRSEVFNIIIIFITASCLLDCVVNETTAFVFLLSWRPVASTWWCEGSAATFMLILILQTSAVCLLCLERYLALKGKHLDTKETLTYTVSCCLFGIVTRIWAGNGSVNYFPSRNVCGVTPGHEGISVLTLLFGFIVPWLTITALVVASFIQFHDKIKSIQDSPNLSTLQVSSSTAQHISTLETKHYKITLNILLFYCILMIPHAITVLATQITTPNFYPNYWENPKNTTSQVRAVMTGVHDAAFTWSRFQYNIVTPVLIFITYKHLRKHSKLLFLHRQRQNSVNNLKTKSSPRTRNSFVGTSHALAPDLTSHMLSPVLFASSNGLHLRTTMSEQVGGRSSIPNSNFAVTVCDLTVDDVKIVTVKNASVVTPLEESEEEVRTHHEGGVKKNVRFSSVVNEIPLLESGVFGSTEETTDGANITHTVELPVFVKTDAYFRDTTFMNTSEM